MSDVRDAAHVVWCQVFEGGPYTSLKMLQYLLRKARVSAQEFVNDPKLLTTVRSQDIAHDDLYNSSLYESWASKTGRCTSFAIKVCALLQQQYPDVFKFQIYDLKGHRVARCVNTGILIDSSSMAGALRLDEGEWLSTEGSDARWKWLKGKSKFERGGRLKTSAEVISAHDAVSICMREVASGSVAIALFRSVSKSKTPEYHGFLSWLFKKRRLEMISDIKYKAVKVVIQWGVSGATEEDELKCMALMQEFVTTYGGPNWREQWSADGINAIHEAFWGCATNLWGYPVVFTEK